VERRTTSEIGSVITAGNIFDGVISENPDVAFFSASYPLSKTGYSIKPFPFGMVRKSDSRQEKTEEI